MLLVYLAGRQVMRSCLLVGNWEEEVVGVGIGSPHCPAKVLIPLVSSNYRYKR
jgi:hypothetical protein